MSRNLIAVLAVAGVVVGAAALALIADYGVEATVVRKDCGSGTPVVDVRTRLGGLEETVSVGRAECLTIQVGNFVVYHIRSGRTVIYDREGGTCLYDTASVVC